jgi:hypothetical protein
MPQLLTLVLSVLHIYHAVDGNTSVSINSSQQHKELQVHRSALNMLQEVYVLKH